MSYFASLWQKTNREINLQLTNIKIDYLNTALFGKFNPSSLQAYILGNKNYIRKPIDIKQAVQNAYTSLLENSYDNIKMPRNKKEANQEIHNKVPNKYIALVKIFTNIFYIRKFGYKYENLDIDHGIVPVNLGLDAEQNNRINHIKFNSLGNLFLISRITNSKKGSQTLYQYATQHHCLNKYRKYLKATHYFIEPYCNSNNGMNNQYHRVLRSISNKDYGSLNSIITERGKEILTDLIKYFYYKHEN